jgi:aspartyl-tRNA(Asn)/glutamyl-tRNA(Gln) amidotransferase subunit A
MQLMGDYFADDLLLNVAHRYQQETQWHHAHPAVRAREA